MLSKKALLGRIIGKKVNIITHLHGEAIAAALQIADGSNRPDHYSVITNVGEDIFEAAYHAGNRQTVTYYSIHHVVTISGGI